jgi:hypothetical protein
MRKIFRKATLALACLVTVAPGCSAPAEGKLDQDLVRRVVRAHFPETRECYAAVLASDAEASGVVGIDFTIGTDGEVSDAVVFADDFANAALQTCMRETVLRWKFPRPEGGPVVISYPFLFVPNDPRVAS